MADLSVTERAHRMRHRTPRYVYDRARQFVYERRHPRAPWITPEAARLLTFMLRSQDRGLEFGSGRSTIWFAERVRHLTSVEHDQRWHAQVSELLHERCLDNVDYVLAPLDQPPELGGSSEYASAALAFAETSLDFVLVDGAYRDHTAMHVLSKIKPGGILIIDNVNWYLPSGSRAPNSRTAALGPDGPVWRRVAQDLAGWRSIWTSSGVWDTAVFIKP
jgi:predicted O-methyltransferase YrrM